MELAPVILFAYNRPELVYETLRSLSANLLADVSKLIIFSDGPKPNFDTNEIRKIEEVRRILRLEQWCASVEIREAAVNKGLANSVIDGVTEVIEKCGKVIVLEDDVILSPFFLSYMNAALNKYEDRKQVMAIGSWTYFTRRDFKGEPFFFRFVDSIAWGTYKRSWDLFEKDSLKMLQKLNEQSLLTTFNGFRNIGYFEPMFQKQIEGKIDSWAIRWTATTILNGGLSVFPPVSMAKHMGFTKDSTHEKDTVDYNADLPLATEEVLNMPDTISEHPEAIADWRKFIRTTVLDVGSRKRKYLNIIREDIPAFLHRLLGS